MKNYVNPRCPEMHKRHLCLDYFLTIKFSYIILMNEGKYALISNILQ